MTYRCLKNKTKAQLLKKPHKIAIYSGEIPSTTFIERLIKGLSDKGQHVQLFGIKKKGVSYAQNVSIIGYKNSRFGKALHLLKYSLLLVIFKYKDKRILDNLLQSQSRNTLNDKVKSYPVLWHKPDIFHVQWAKGIDDWIWVQEFGIKLVLSLRGAHINYSPVADSHLAKMYKKVFPQVDGFHAVSKDIAQEAQKYGAASDKIHVVYSGLDLNLMKKIINNKPNNVLKLISVGRSHWKKGYTYALDACNILKEKNIPFLYQIIGGRSNLELAYQIKELQLGNHVELLDRIPFTEVIDLFQSSDLLILPSVEEGVANVVLEAMALGTLVLTTDCGGMQEVISDGYNGFVIPIRDSKRMAAAIVKVNLLSENEKSQLIKNAYQTIHEQHTNNEMVLDMLELYDSL